MSILTPFGPYSFVWDKVAIGGILAYGEPLTPFGFIMNVAWEITDYGGVSEEFVRGVRVLHARLNDDDDIEPQIPEILRAVALVVKAHSEGHPILVTCAAGRNRSGLVVAESLIQLGNDPKKVISSIQARRAHALSNDTFVQWLMRKRNK